jgi:hypothetical protein
VTHVLRATLPGPAAAKEGCYVVGCERIGEHSHDGYGPSIPNDAAAKEE